MRVYDFWSGVEALLLGDAVLYVPDEPVPSGAIPLRFVVSSDRAGFVGLVDPRNSEAAYVGYSAGLSVDGKRALFPGPVGAEFRATLGAVAVALRDWHERGDSGEPFHALVGEETILAFLRNLVAWSARREDLDFYGYDTRSGVFECVVGAN